MDRVTKNLERALIALQLANNEIDRLRILKRDFEQVAPQSNILREIKCQISNLEKSIVLAR